MYTLKINGEDITPYIAPKMRFGWNALDGDNAGRTLDGVMKRDYRGDKEKLEISCRPLENSEFWYLSDILRGGKDFDVEYRGVASSDLRRITCYNTSFQGECYTTSNNRTLWIGVAFNLIEK